MSCGIQYHQKQLSMSSDVILDTVPCLPYRPSSRPRPVIISYRIPDDTATQSITCDTGYDDTSPISSPYCFPPRFPPHRVARRVGSRHDVILHAIRSVCLLVSSHLIDSFSPSVACPPRPTHVIARRRYLANLIGLSPVPPSFPLCFPSSVQPRLATPDYAIATPPSDKTSDEQVKRRTGTGNRRRAI